MLLTRAELETSTVPGRFGAVARRYPGSVAVRFANGDTTFGELDARSDNLAYRLLEILGDQVEPVPFLLEPGPELAVAILGILKAGKAYVALDPLEPGPVLEQFLSALKARLVVTHSDMRDRPLSLSRLEIDGRQASALLPLPVLSPEQPASLILTSGSSGQPKILERSHRALLHRAYLYQSEHGLGPGDRQALLAGAHFVASESDLLGPLLTGATVCPFPTHPLNVRDVKLWLERERVTMLHPPVSFLRRLVATLTPTPHYPDLRLIALGGEAVMAEEIAVWRKSFASHCRWLHRYSSSEAGNVSSFLVTESLQDGAVVPAGYACCDKEISIVDEHGGELSVGQTGRVKVRSRFLSTGYWKDPKATRAAFSDGACLTGDLGHLDEAGCLRLEGRADSQVKVRGNRVNLAALESLLLAHPAVREAAVVVEEGERLVAHLVATQERERPADLAAQVETRLGRHYRPDRVDWHTSLPLNRNGKLDRLRLAKPDSSSQAPETGPSAPGEETLRAIWEAHLGVAIKPTDSFFAAGGTSLSAGEIIVEIERLLGVALEPSALARAPSPREMAAYLSRGPGGGLLVPIRTVGNKPPLFAVHANHGQVLGFHTLAERLGPDQPLYAFRSRGLLRTEQLPTCVKGMAREYVREMRTVQPRGPYRLIGRCFGASVALEMAFLLLAEGEKVERLIVLDGPGPLPRLDPVREEWRKLRLRYQWARPLILDPLLGTIEVLQRLHQNRLASSPAEAPRPYRTPHRHFSALQQFYSSPAYPGEIVLLYGEGPISEAALRDWTRVTQGRIRAFAIPCSHAELLREPFLRLVARELRQFL